MTGAERRYSRERRLRFWYFDFTSSLRKNKQVSVFHPGGASHASGLRKGRLLEKTKQVRCERGRKEAERSSGLIYMV